jgi:hypothetical protein
MQIVTSLVLSPNMTQITGDCRVFRDYSKGIGIAPPNLDCGPCWDRKYQASQALDLGAVSGNSLERGHLWVRN